MLTQSELESTAFETLGEIFFGEQTGVSLF